jgi:hypothetical protein
VAALAAVIIKHQITGLVVVLEVALAPQPGLVELVELKLQVKELRVAPHLAAQQTQMQKVVQAAVELLRLVVVQLLHKQVQAAAPD